ncbi:hypothetical protein FRC08_018332 [Ceratobasidium sp. 394]|nr:hypothetical protein FRC08_018332 [Ceratobasidium sp. 394]
MTDRLRSSNSTADPAPPENSDGGSDSFYLGGWSREFECAWDADSYADWVPGLFPLTLVITVSTILSLAVRTSILSRISRNHQETRSGSRREPQARLGLTTERTSLLLTGQCASSTTFPNPKSCNYRFWSTTRRLPSTISRNSCNHASHGGSPLYDTWAWDSVELPIPQVRANAARPSPIPSSGSQAGPQFAPAFPITTTLGIGILVLRACEGLELDRTAPATSFGS